jgi:hypothetical protein
MVALAADRDTPELASAFSQLHAETAASSTQFYKGGIVVLDQADGLMKKGSTATGLIAMGRCSENILTPASNTDKVECRSGIFKYGNSASADLIAADDVGKDCFIVDDQTVALTNGTNTRSRAGKVYRVDPDGGVWVSFTFPLAT